MSRQVFAVVFSVAMAATVFVPASSSSDKPRNPQNKESEEPFDIKEIAQEHNALIKRAGMMDCFDQQKMSQCFFRLSAGFRLPLCTAEAMHNVSLQIDEASCCPRCRPTAKCNNLSPAKLMKLPACKVPLHSEPTKHDFASAFFDSHFCPKCNFLQVVQRPGHEKPEDHCDLLHIPACPVNVSAAAAAAAADPAQFTGVDLRAFAGPDDDCDGPVNTCAAKSVCPSCRKLPLALCPPGRLHVCLAGVLPVCERHVKPVLSADCCPSCRPLPEAVEPPATCGKRQRVACARTLLPPCGEGVAPVFNITTCCFDCMKAPLLVPGRDDAHRKCSAKEVRTCVANQPVCPDGVLPIFNLSMCCMSCKRHEDRCSPREVAKCRAMTKACPPNVRPFHAVDLCCPVCHRPPKVCNASRSCAARSERCGFKHNVATCRNVSHVHLFLRNLTADSRAFFRNLTPVERLNFFIELVERFCRLIDNVQRCAGVLEALREMELSEPHDNGHELLFNATVVPPDAEEVADSNLLLDSHSPTTAVLLAYANMRLFGDGSKNAALTASVLTDALNSNAALAGESVTFSASAAVVTGAGTPTNNDGNTNNGGNTDNGGIGGNTNDENPNSNAPAQQGDNGSSAKLPAAALYAIIAGGGVLVLAAIVGGVLCMRSRKRQQSAGGRALAGVELHSTA